jgi:UDP-N-acetylglucosamine 2-epimerase (non-hydrolysing)
MKMAPVVAELERRPDRFRSVLVHTGQHYDREMSGMLMDELDVSPPDHLLGVGSGTHAEQTARVMERLEPVIRAETPDLMLVPGDVNSTLGAALVGSKLGIRIGHVEAGLRSFDRTRPEEVNRVVTDALSDPLFIHSPEARDNLIAEGRPESAIHMVGNTMIDTLVRMLEGVRALDAPGRRGLSGAEYLVVTLHRPSLVDGHLLADVLRELSSVAERLPVVFPCHPRTRRRMAELSVPLSPGLDIVDPLGYAEFLGLVDGAAGVLTDSGGIQEETTYLGVPCFTLRSTTERPVTCRQGTNTLLGLAPERIAEIPDLIAAMPPEGRSVPDLWDGHAATRLVDVIDEELSR